MEIPAFAGMTPFLLITGIKTFWNIRDSVLLDIHIRDSIVLDNQWKNRHPRDSIACNDLNSLWLDPGAESTDGLSKAGIRVHRSCLRL
jgi:hypothetical protein